MAIFSSKLLVYQWVTDFFQNNNDYVNRHPLIADLARKMSKGSRFFHGGNSSPSLAHQKLCFFSVFQHLLKTVQ
jgi:hypothetical protein